jgi:hypothetical protein
LSIIIFSTSFDDYEPRNQSWNYMFFSADSTNKSIFLLEFMTQ